MAEDSAPDSTADSAAWRFIERSAKRIGWLRATAMILGGVFSGGFVVHSVYADVATKDDVAAAIKIHTDDAARGFSRIDSLERWRVEHEAQHNADVYWIKASLGRLLDQQRIPRPPEKLPISTPAEQP